MSPLVEQDYRDLLVMLSIGLLEQTEPSDNRNSHYLISAALRRGWAQLNYLFYRAGFVPPATIQELSILLHQPLPTWNLINEYCVSQGYVFALLEDGQPTALCQQLGSSFLGVQNLDLELQDERFKELQHTCRQLGLTQQYTAARTFLIRNPIVEDPIISFAADETWHPIVREQLMACYELVPPSTVCDDGTKRYVVCCPWCGWTLQWRKDEASCFFESSCTQLFGDLSESDKHIPFQRNMRRTTEGVQRFVVAPEIALIQLYDQLTTELGLRCELFPNFDAYDLLVYLPNGQHWAVDMKDHRRATQLALSLNKHTFKFSPEWQRAFYLLPDHRAKPHYLREFGNYWIKQHGVNFASTQQFLDQVKAQLYS